MGESGEQRELELWHGPQVPGRTYDRPGHRSRLQLVRFQGLGEGCGLGKNTTRLKWMKWESSLELF